VPFYRGSVSDCQCAAADGETAFYRWSTTPTRQGILCGCRLPVTGHPLQGLAEGLCQAGLLEQLDFTLVCSRSEELRDWGRLGLERPTNRNARTQLGHWDHRKGRRVCKASLRKPTFCAPSRVCHWALTAKLGESAMLLELLIVKDTSRRAVNPRSADCISAPPLWPKPSKDRAARSGHANVALR